MVTFFEWLFGIEKSPEQIRREIEEQNEQNYRENKLKVLKESREFKDKHKDIIEHRLKKPISKVTLKDLWNLGFNSDHMTRKHAEEIINETN